MLPSFSTEHASAAQGAGARLAWSAPLRFPRAVALAWVSALPLGLILFTALVLRVWALDRGLPWSFHPDEKHYVDVARNMLNAGDPNPHYFANPSAMTYLIAGQVWLERQAAGLLGLPALATRSAQYLAGRLESALFGVATVWLVYLIGRLFDRTVGLVAGALLAVTFLHVRDSHFAVNDVPAAALLTLSVYFAARFADRPTLRSLLLAGAAGGLGTSTKYSVGFFFVPILVAVAAVGLRAVAPRRAPGQAPSVPLLRLMLWLALAGLTAVLAYLVGTPYTVLDAQEFLLQFKTQMAVGDVRGIGKPLAPIPEQMLAALNQGFGPLPLALAVVGLVAGLWRAPRVPTLVIAAFPAVYLAYMLPKSWFVPRVLQPVLPAFALLAAAGIVVLARRAPPRWRGLALGLLLVAASGQSVVYSLYHNWVLSQTDTRVLAHQWMQANLPPGSSVLVELYTVLDQLEPIPNPADLRFEYFVVRPTDDQFDVLLADGVDYYLSSSLFFRRYDVDPATTRTQARSRARFYGMLAQRGRQLRTFVPTRDGQEPPYTGEDTKSPFWNLLSYARPGPTLRLYALKRSDSGAGRSPAGSSGG